MAQSPKYDLHQVLDIVKAKIPGTIWFSAPSRSLYEVIRVYSAADAPKSQTEAADFICAAILRLTADDFVERVLQWDVVADVYGLIYDGRPWYVKFVLKDGALEEISFHPPEKPLRTVGGLKILVEEKKT